MPNLGANGIPEVVPGPKKSPKAPAATRTSFGLLIGRVCVQLGSRQKAVALARLFTGVGRPAMLATKLLPGFTRLNRLKNSTNGRRANLSPKRNSRLTRRST